VPGEHRQGFADFLQACLIPVPQFKLPDFVLPDFDRILKLVDLVQVLRIIGIDQCADCHPDITGSDILLGKRVRLGVVSDVGDIMMFIDDHQ
jgi:hypothetical protein